MQSRHNQPGRQACQISYCPPLPSSPDLPDNTLPFSVTTTLWVPVQNGSKFTRGKKKVREDIEWLIESDFDGTALGDNEYRLTFSYKDDADLKEQIEELFDEIYTTAEIRNCVVDDMSLTDDATGRSWDEAGGWRQ